VAVEIAVAVGEAGVLCERRPKTMEMMKEAIAGTLEASELSGNLRLKDVGVFLRDQIARDSAVRGIKISIQSIDPSYIIRSLPAHSLDSELCLMLGQQAVHAGMAGRADTGVGYWNQHFTHIPIALMAASRNQLDPQGDVWQYVLHTTGQPAVMISDTPA
jgi:6-phosphofructokinase 1